MPVTIMGAGPPVVLLHGISANHTEWIPVARLLSDRFRVILPDLLGRGGSSPEPGARYTLADETKRLVLVLETLGIHRPVVGGHSHGATLALALTSQIPCRRIVLVSPVTPRTKRPPALDALRSAAVRMTVLPVIGICRRPVTRYILTRRVYGDRRPDIESAVSRYSAPYADRSRARALLQILADWQPAEVGQLIRPEGIPVHVTTGGRDRRISVEHAMEWARTLGAEFTLAPGAGHGLTEERPQLCAQLISDGCGGRWIDQ